MCFVGTYAWFVASRVDTANNMQVQMYTHELDMSYRVYKYSDDDKAPINATHLPDALSLVEYDSVIKSRNENTPIIIEFLITGMALDENIPIYINTHCNETNATTHFLSNIIELKFGVIDSITSEDANVVYTSATSYFNNISGVKFRQGNSKVQDVLSILERENFDIVLCNPPYKKADSHKISEKAEIAMCKYETMLTFDELCSATSKLLRFGGKFCFVHESNRLCEIVATLQKYNLEPKKIEVCYPAQKKESNVVLVEAVKGGKSGVIITKTTN